MESLNSNKDKLETIFRYKIFLKTLLIMTILVANSPRNTISAENNIKNTFSKEPIENTIEINKQIIQSAIQKSLSKINHIDQLPKKIYYPDNKVNNVPDCIDINPKIITEPIEGVTVVLGDRMFYIKPILGKILDMSIENKRSTTDKVLRIETTYINKTYSIDQSIPELCYKLWNTPKSKGEKSGFMGTRIIEI